MKAWTAASKSKILLPDNVSGDEFPSFEIVHVGNGMQSPHNGVRELVPYVVGDRVIVSAGRVAGVTLQGEKLFIVEWSMILAKVVE